MARGATQSIPKRRKNCLAGRELKYALMCSCIKEEKCYRVSAPHKKVRNYKSLTSSIVKPVMSAIIDLSFAFAQL